MALVLADRVRETTTTTGTGTISLAGPVSGFQGFSTAIGNANTTYYTIVDAATGAWEVGLGTYTSSGSTLARTTVLSSSNSDALVSFGAGTKDVFVTQPAERAVYVLGAGTGLAAGAAAFTSNGVPYASATNTLTTGSTLTFDGNNLSIGANGQVGSRLTVIANGAMATFNTGAAADGRIEYAYNGTNIFYTGVNSASLMMFMARSGVQLGFGANNSEQMRLTSTGLGIGTSSPSSKLALKDTSPQIDFITAAASDTSASIQGSVDTGTGGKLVFITKRNGNTPIEQMRLDSSGNLGIGTTNPLQKLVVSLAGAQGLEISPDAVASAPSLIAYNRSGGSYVQLTSLALQHVWQSGASPSERMRLDSSGNLGIGTSSPAAKIEGHYTSTAPSLSSSSGAGLSLRGSSSLRVNIGSDPSSPFGGWIQASDNGGNAFPLNLNPLGGNVGIGTSSPGAKLHIDGNFIRIEQSGANTAYFGNAADLITGTPAGVAIRFNNTALRIAYSSTQIAMFDTSGNLGLGVTPSAWGSGWPALQVFRAVMHSNTSDGRASFGNNYYVDGTNARYIATAAATQLMQVSGEHRFFNAPSGLAGDPITFTQAMTLDASGNLLVGTTISSVTSGVGHKIRPDAAAPFMGTVGSSTSGADVTYSLYSTGAAAYRFYVGYNGTISATTTTISAISDIRFKENVRDLDVGLEKIMALKPRLYDWKKGKGADIKNARGFIAQEFEQVFPDLIDEWKDPAPEGEEPYKAVRADLIPVLVKAIQELNAKVQALEAQLKGA